ncbi:MAG TPA: TIM-barrel domain-containing protein [Solirubrobacteraceae bacterium]|nr:TIM-barrel domain-containing protein [Solirubrobacteraceae bacterium]
MRGGLCALVAVGVLAFPAGAGAVETLAAGGLRVEVREDPFELRFVDARDGDVLRTLGVPGGDPRDPQARYGTLGYAFDLRQPVLNNAVFGYYGAAEGRTAWFHARRVVRVARPAADRLELELATNDPMGHRLLAVVERRDEGVVTVTSRVAPGSGPYAGSATTGGAAFAAAGGERYLGFGSRSNAVDQTGREVFNWAEEGPFSSGNAEAVLRPLVPDFTFPSGPAATNLPIPWLLSTRGLGVLIDQTHRSRFRLGSERSDAWQAETETGSFRFTVFAGPKPSDVVRRYSAYAGRQPEPRRWLFGPWVQFRDGWEARFRERDVPATVGQTYTHYLPCGEGRDAGAERALVDRYHRLGYMITTYFNSHVCTSYSAVYDEAARNGWFVKDRSGRPYLITNPFTREQVASVLDFTSPGATRLYARLLDEALDRGYDGWMEDFGEYVPTDSVSSDGRDGFEMHNLYPVLYHRASTEHTKTRRGDDLAVYVRSGFHGVQRWARVVWGGDPTEDWSCADGLCAALHQALSTGLSGIAYQGSDIGGFHAAVNPRTSDELNIRWLQLGAVSGVMRTQANGYSVHAPREQRSQVWSPAVLPIWRRYAKLRTQLAPYIEAASRAYQRTGLPIVRHLALAFPTDPRAVARSDELLFGPDLLAAPVVEPAARTRRVYLPSGPWVDLWRSVAYDERDGSLSLRRAALLPGRREVTVPAPLTELPLFARAGTMLAMHDPGVDTLATVGSGPGLVHADDRPALRILAFPHGGSSGRFNRTERLDSLEHRRAWRLRIVGARARVYALQASLSTLRRPFRPCRVTLDGRRLGPRAWSYDANTGAFRATFRARRHSTLRVHATGCR